MSGARGGKRAAPRPARRAGSRSRNVASGAAFLLVPAAAVVALLTPPMAHRTTSAPPPERSPVTDTMLGCPALRPPLRVKSEAGVGLAGADALAASEGVVEDAGRVELGAIGAAPDQLSSSRGELVAPAASGETGLLVHGVGGPAVGLFAARADHGAASGAAVACLPPRASWWFTGAGAAVGHTTVLTMSNLDAGTAVVDVRVFGRDGEIETTGTRGLTIEPGATTRLPLVEVAPQSDEVAVWVRASRGRVTAAMSDAFETEPGKRPGYEWLPSQVEPAKEVYLSGLPAAATERTLLLSNPGDLAAVVGIRVAGESGTFAPLGLAEVTVAPGATAVVDLSDAIGREPVALVLGSSRPLVATVRSVVGEDTSYAAAVEPFTEPMVGLVPGYDRPAVHLTALEEAATVVLTTYDRDGGQVEQEQVVVKGGTTATWAPSEPASYVVARRLSGSVLGSVVALRPGVTSVALTELPLLVTRPLVVPLGS